MNWILGSQARGLRLAILTFLLSGLLVLGCASGLSVSIRINLAAVEFLKGLTDGVGAGHLQNAVSGLSAIDHRSLPLSGKRFLAFARFSLREVQSKSEMEAVFQQGDIFAGYFLGRAALEDGDWQTALAYLEQAGCIKYGCIGDKVGSLMQQGQQTEAVSLLEAYVARQPRQSVASYVLADLYWQIGDVQNTVRALEQGRLYDPVPTTLDSRFRSAWLAYLKKDYAQASESLADLQIDYPDEFRVWYLMGQVQLVQGAYSQAEAALRRAIEILPAHPWAHLYLANALRSQQKWDEAALENLEAIHLKPDQPQFLTLLAEIYQEAGMDCLADGARQIAEKNPDAVETALQDLLQSCNAPTSP